MLRRKVNAGLHNKQKPEGIPPAFVIMLFAHTLCQLFIHFVSDAFAGVGAPEHAALRVVLRDEAAFTHRGRENREHFNLSAAFWAGFLADNSVSQPIGSRTFRHNTRLLML
jgi:hypothetical protein